MILNSLLNGPLVWPTVVEEDGTTRTKKYEEISVAEKLQADCDLKATNIVLQGLPPDMYAIVNHHKVAKEIWDRVKLLMQGMKLSLQEKECKWYDEFDKFSLIKGETLYQYYLIFAQLINNMDVINMSMRQVQVNTKFLNSLPPEWSKSQEDSSSERKKKKPRNEAPESLFYEYEAKSPDSDPFLSYKLKTRLRDVAVYYHFAISTFPDKIVIRSSAFINLLHLPIRIDELMHPHLPIPPRYQNWTIEEEEALCDDDEKHGIGNWISILSDSQLALAKLMDQTSIIRRAPRAGSSGPLATVEEELLATCYVAVSEDNNVGRSQKHDTFWYRVLNEFNSKKFQNRTKDMLTSKWHTLNANCQKFNAAYKRAKRLGKSGENDVDYLKRAQSIYRDEHRGVAFSQEDAWAVLRFHPKWDAPEQVDLTGDVPGASQEDLFGHDARPRPPGKQRPAKKSKSDATASTGGSSASAQFGELMEQELRLKREAAERAFEAQAEKDRTLMRLEELRFLATSTKDLDEDDAYWIKKQKKLIKNKMKNDLGDEDDEDEDE
ncbi:transposon ty3-I gag-pol polyprotein [Tanacetum coccineum]|uniref:Transposon ty3-I gag-pol polyprotein n=2 Tax=Tanacetum coccineum TaxID=301880 RepID=A0ABQ5DAY4_9ASTR